LRGAKEAPFSGCIMEIAQVEQLEKRLDEVLKKHAELEKRLGDPSVAGNSTEYREVAKRHNDLSKVAEAYGAYKKLKDQLESARELIAANEDAEIVALAEADRDEAEQGIPALLDKLQLLLLPKDPLDEKNIIIELRAGTGGEEAAIFAADLFRMYGRYAELRGWKMEILQANESSAGAGYREIIASVSGEAVYSRLKFESGVHRVQRVPETEAQGRIHTSAATVAVLPEAEEVDVKIDPNDLRIDVYRSTGHGGQSVNTTDSAVRITHNPSGLVVTCQDEKSQIKNKAKAMRVLRSRLLDLEMSKQAAERSSARRSMVGTGDRSERIRTYNFPQNRLTDHRINLTLYSLDRVLEGGLEDLINALALEDQTERLRNAAVAESA
jgi:peptide chain release factor 1